MECIVVQHVAFEDIGVFGPVLAEHGFRLKQFQAGVDDFGKTDWNQADLVVVLGGPIGVNDRDAFPFLQEEIAMIRRRIDSNKPLLGICLGAQLIASALGAMVYRGKEKEIGWGHVTLTAAGLGSPLAALDGGVPVLHWHGDTFDLPVGAELLASTAITPNQAFRYGARVLALQFHVEADSTELERWLIGHVGELVQNGLSVPAIRRQSQLEGDAARGAGQSMLRNWLSQL